MKISVIGPVSAAEHLSKKLCLESNVDKVYHHGSFNAFFDKKYFPIRQYPLASIKNFRSDLIVVLGRHIQLSEEWHQEISKIGIPYIFPSRKNILYEISRIETKKIFQKLDIPTPDYAVYKYQELIDNFTKIKRPFVIKFDEDFRNGEQTVIIDDNNYLEELKKLKVYGSRGRFRKKYFGSSIDQKFIVEKFIESSREYSYHVIMNKTGWRYLGSARDYKKRYDGDRGPNTNGMGSYGLVDADEKVKIYIDKLFEHFQDNDPYIGIFFIGIIVDKQGQPFVLEINSRPGIPEIHTILPTIDSSLSELLYCTATNFKLPEIEFNKFKTVAVGLMNFDHWSKSEKLKSPDLSNLDTDLKFYLDEYKITGDSFGCLVCTSPSLSESSSKIYKFLENKNTGDFVYRKDIGILL